MPQNPIPTSGSAETPAGTFLPQQADVAGNLKISNQGDTGLTNSGPLGAATQVTVGPGVLKSVENLATSFFTTTAIAALTTTQIGSFYDALLISTALGSLTTTQVATLSTTQLRALAPPTTADISFGGGNGLPITQGLVFVPGSTQVANVLKK